MVVKETVENTEVAAMAFLLQKLFIGRALRDQEATIIHHFAFHDDPSSFAYPDFMSCFLLTFPLIQRSQFYYISTVVTFNYSLSCSAKC